MRHLTPVSQKRRGGDGRTIDGEVKIEKIREKWRLDEVEHTTKATSHPFEEHTNFFWNRFCYVRLLLLDAGTEGNSLSLYGIFP